MTAGRPPMYESPEDMQTKVDEYFDKIASGYGGHEKRPTITGLVLHLGFCDRTSFYAYEKKPKFKHTIKSARQRIENVYENMLGAGNSAGPIFALKNFGWIDKQEVDASVNINVVRKTYADTDAE